MCKVNLPYNSITENVLVKLGNTLSFSFFIKIYTISQKSVGVMNSTNQAIVIQFDVMNVISIQSVNLYYNHNMKLCTVNLVNTWWHGQASLRVVAASTFIQTATFKEQQFCFAGE